MLCFSSFFLKELRWFAFWGLEKWKIILTSKYFSQSCAFPQYWLYLKYYLHCIVTNPYKIWILHIPDLEYWTRKDEVKFFQYLSTVIYVSYLWLNTFIVLNKIYPHSLWMYQYSYLIDAYSILRTLFIPEDGRWCMFWCSIKKKGSQRWYLFICDFTPTLLRWHSSWSSHDVINSYLPESLQML